MRRKRLIWGTLLCVFSVALLVALRFFAIAEPQTQLAFALFKSSYALSSNKSVMLQGYDANLIRYNAGYIPKQVDKFLCSKLQRSASDGELSAIVDFYAFKAGGREGRCIFLLPAKAKQLLVDLVLRRLDKYSPLQATRALILVEVVRRGAYLGKAHFRSNRSDIPRYPKYETWWRQVGLPEARSRFRKWGSSYSTWQQKEIHNPLEGSSVQIYSP